MSDIVSLARRVSQVDVSPQFDNYSKVVIHVSDETTYVAGNDTGRTLEIDNPFGTQAMANNMLQSLTGYQYQPYEAQGALLDPAAEIGDAVNMRGAYGGIYTRERTFGRLMKADVSAPHDEEINHEYQYESPEERRFTRQINDVKASLIIANDSINAKVSQESPEGQTSFSWKLLSDSHRWYANGREVMSVTASGLKVSGEVEATSGKIGGFNISASAIWNNISYFGGSQSSGVYIGTNGIQLGQNFAVDNGGNLRARNIDLYGTLNFYNYNGSYAGSMSTANFLTGASEAYNNYGSWNGATSTVNNNGSYWSGGASYGYGYGNAISRSSGVYPSYFRASDIYAENGLATGYVNCTGNCTVSGRFYVGGYQASWQTKTINGVTINYLGR